MPIEQSTLLDASMPQEVFCDRNLPMGDLGEVSVDESDLSEEELRHDCPAHALAITDESN